MIHVTFVRYISLLPGGGGECIIDFFLSPREQTASVVYFAEDRGKFRREHGGSFNSAFRFLKYKRGTKVNYSPKCRSSSRFYTTLLQFLLQNSPRVSYIFPVYFHISKILKIDIST